MQNDNNINIDKTSISKAPSPERIKWFESAYRIKLPKSYIQFLENYNGAKPLDHNFEHQGTEKLIEKYLPILENPKSDDKNGMYDINVVISQLDARLVDDEDLVGMTLIPFAALFGGDFLCLDYRDNPSEPKIVFWDHNESDDFLPCTEDVSKDFNSFIQKFT